MIENISINRSETLSLHVQLVEQLKYQIETGGWGPGARLPTVRELAQALRLNYNTARAAYQELERRGYLVTQQGRGTFVSEEPPRPAADREVELLDIIDEALLKARALGVPAGAFARAAYARAKLFSPVAQGRVRLLFAECNRADLEHHAATIEAGTGLWPETWLLDELRAQSPEFFDRFDLLTTTLFHVAELQEIAGAGRPALGLMVEPSYLEVTSEIGRLPAGACIGLVCASQAGAEQMERALRGVGVEHLDFLVAGADQPGRLEKVFRETDQVYVSRLAQRGHPDPWPEHAAVREYVDDIDPVALRLLRENIAHLSITR